MKERTTQPAVGTEELSRLTLDIDAMREFIALLLVDDAGLPSYDASQDMILRLRGHLALAIPVVEDDAMSLPVGHTVRNRALDVLTQVRIGLHKASGLSLVSVMVLVECVALGLCGLRGLRGLRGRLVVA